MLAQGTSLPQRRMKPAWCAANLQWMQNGPMRYVAIGDSFTEGVGEWHSRVATAEEAEAARAELGEDVA